HPGKKLYYHWESRQLQRFYSKIPPQTPFACLSLADKSFLVERFGFLNTSFIPCFIPWQQVTSGEGKGDYCLYHGNMTVAENEGAALWLMKEVFRDLSIPLVIAGNGISMKVQNEAARNRFVRCINNPPMDELGALVKDAQINVLPSLNATGVKLKLVHSLFTGRFCIVNTNGVKGSALENMVCIADNPTAFKSTITELYDRPFLAADKKNREALLTVYNNMENAKKLSALW
ncbi:MAG TPA: mannosyltransferase, partial [Chitinophagaceae bacterium]|nr:mannosyltransferase [Chitinophagaceae bacterium]